LIKLEQTYSANLNVLFNVLSSHPSIDGEFAKKIAKMAKKIAAILNPESEFVESVGLAGMLCELGFIGLDEDLVDTPYTLMNAAQLKQFKQQGNIASLILAPASHLANVAQMLREQYRPFIPLLDESEPCLGAQILAVVRDYQRILDGRYFSEAMPEKRAMAELVKHKGNRYSSTIIDLILEQPNLLDTKAKESTLTIDQLEPGMILLEDLLTESNILLLPEGHVFNQRTITRIRQFQNTIPGKLSLSVSNPLENEN
jgi:response regulator RpfG family c-di-GMP phosphodiesterase